MKIRSKKTKLFIVILVLILVVIGCTTILVLNQCGKEDKIYNHRLEWWLNYIDWDTDRLKYNGKGIKVAVLDTGIDAIHPDINHSIKKEFTINNNKSKNSDNLAHGTSVVGIISGFPNNDKGILGVATGSEITSIDITDNDVVEIDNLIKGIKIAIDNKVDIINISVGVKVDSDSLHKCIQQAYKKGIIVVASAGNYMNNDILYPASYKEVICVGSIDKKGNIISPQGRIQKNVIYLPGENVVTACTTATEYVDANGTSFSAPILTGIIALMKEANPNISINDIYISLFQ